MTDNTNPIEPCQRAGGKVILLGEHAVVYGHSALVLGGRNGARAWARLAPESCLRLGEKHHCISSSLPSELSPALSAFRALLHVLNAPSVRVEAQLDIPAGMGLGASAALAVAIARAVVVCRGEGAKEPERAKNASSGEILAAANAWENVFHGNASGVDTAAALQAGCLWFNREEGATRLAVPQMPHAVVAVADRAASTRVMVENVARQRTRHPLQVGALFDRIGQLAQSAKLWSLQGNWQQVGALMSQNHLSLKSLGVSTDKLDAACRVAMGAGAYGAKLTGAGGGGCVVALCEASRGPEVVEAWRHSGYQVLQFA